MKRAAFRSHTVIAILIAALLSSVAPVAAAPVFSKSVQRKPKASEITLAHTAEVKVTAGPTGVLVEWRTSFELDNLGFNVYRDSGGKRTQVNPGIIAGSALIAGQGTPLYAGFSYQWFDASGSLDSRYYLEDLDIKGTHTVNGPFIPVWNESLSKSQQAKLISEVAAAQAAATTQTGGPAGVFEKPPIAPAAIQDQWAIAAQAGLKIGVKQDGWYRVTQPEMVAAGFDVSADARNLRLFVDGTEAPIEVSRSGGPLTANDFLEFYGAGLDTPTTDTHVYYLVNGSQAGLRVPVFGEIQPDAIPVSSPRPAPLASPAADTAGRFSSGSWIGDISSGVAADRETRKQQVDPTNQSQSVSCPLSEESKVINSLPFIDTPKANSAAAKIAPPDTATVSRAGNSSLNPKALTSPAPFLQTRQLRRRNMSRRRRATRRRRHATYRKRNHAAANVTPGPGFLYDVQLKERFVYFSSLLNGAAENFFGGSLLNPATTKTLKVTSLQTDSQGTALLRIGLQGTTNQVHVVNVLVNDSMVGTMNFASQQYAQQTFNVAVSQLQEGDNVIKFVIAGGSGDLSLYSYARLTYPRTFRAENDALSFAVRSSQSAKIDGFTTPNIRVLDISNPSSVQEVHPLVADTGSGFSGTVPSAGARSKGTRTLLALSSDSFLHPASITGNQPSLLNQAGNPANAADLLIISHQAFIPSLAPLVSKRQNEGLTVKVVDIEDVFDEFSYGMHTPQAITDFLARARTTWVNAPRYLLLVGDGSYDPRNYEGSGNADLVPTQLIDTVFMETGSDDTLTDFDVDGIPEIPVGRLPVRTVAEANLVVSKIVNFSPGNVPQSALMVADTQGSYFFNFEKANDDLIPLLPSNMQANVQKIYRAQQPSDAATRASIIAGFNQGAALVNYSGHGNVNVWTGAPIFSASDAMALTNGNKLPLVIVMDCLNGYFVAPSIDCVSEALMKAPNGGAVASFSSSGLTVPTGQHQMGQQLFQLLYSGQPISLGDATRQAKAATNDNDVRRSWILFGDPSMKIR
ncbi:MAG: hypothetical protein QOH41_630 [Blastocatellia bacterium]|jgi:hypothetical protein|nr:hypothetical protein [Blastocatellia bacterium]